VRAAPSPCGSRFRRALLVRSGDLQHGGQSLEAGVAEEDTEPLGEQSLEDVRVPVAVRSKWRLRVVHVQRAQPVEADRGIELVQQRVERHGVGDVDTRDVEVARVEAHAESRMPAEPLVQRRELPDRTADGSPAPAEFSIRSHVSSEHRSSTCSIAGTTRSRPASNPDPRCEPT